MLPSTQNAGLSAAARSSALVTVATQRSRPSWLLPIDSTDDQVRELPRERVNEFRQLGIAVEAIEGDGRHDAEESGRDAKCRGTDQVASRRASDGRSLTSACVQVSDKTSGAVLRSERAAQTGSRR